MGRRRSAACVCRKVGSASVGLCTAVPDCAAGGITLLLLMLGIGDGCRRGLGRKCCGVYELSSTLCADCMSVCIGGNRLIGTEMTGEGNGCSCIDGRCEALVRLKKMMRSDRVGCKSVG